MHGLALQLLLGMRKWLRRESRINLDHLRCGRVSFRPAYLARWASPRCPAVPLRRLPLLPQLPLPMQFAVIIRNGGWEGLDVGRPRMRR